MTPEQLDALKRRYLSARFEEAEAWLAETTDEVARDVIGDELAERGDAVTAALAFGDYSSALERARTLLPRAEELDQLRLARRLLEGELEAIKAECRALSGEALEYPTLRHHAAPAEAGLKETPYLSAVVEMYCAERVRLGKWAPKAELQRRGYFGQIGHLLGDPPIGEVTKEHMRTFATTVPRIPSNASKKYPSKPLTEVIALVGDDASIPRISAKTANTILQLTRSLFAWAVEQDILAQSPAVVLKDHDEGRDQDKRAPFDDADLRALFTHIGEAEGKPWLWWIPRILAYSGMRLGEVAQLRKVDVRQKRGVMVFDVNAEEGKNVKTDAGHRVVPVHPRLVALGFLDFVAQQPDGFLWPAALRSTADDRRGKIDRLSKQLNRYLRTAGITDRRKVMHSFRHTVATRLKEADVQDFTISEILGHEVGSITTGRYGKRVSPPVLLEALSKLTLPI